MKTAAAYIRVSTEDQIEYSPESQIEAIRTYAKRCGYELPEKYIFTDSGISGKNADKRPAFMRMIGTAKTKPKPFDAILLWKFSRFARSREDSIVYKSMLRKQLGIDVISVSENLGDDKISVLIEAMIEAMDEYYSINLAEEVKRGMTEKAKRGEPLSVPPFGYKMENKCLVPVEEEAEIIRQVFDWYGSGLGMLRIAKNLNGVGVRTHRGNKIENRTVEYWLRNPAYIGKIRWTPSGKAERKRQNPDSMIVDGRHEAIVDIAAWEKAQKRMDEQKARYGKWHKPSAEIKNWLAGLVRCGICGGNVVICGGYMYCANRAKGTCTGNGSIRADEAECYVLARLGERLGVSARFGCARRGGVNRDDCEARLKRAQNKMKRIKEAYEGGVDTLEEYRERKRAVQREIEEITNEMLTHAEEGENDSNTEIRASAALLGDDKLSAKEKNLLARCFIEEIIKTGSDGRRLDIIHRK